MAESPKYLKEWSVQLEAGERDDELLAVAARLERASLNEPSAPPVAFKRQLRRELLNQYETAADRPANRLWRLVATTMALGLLAVIVVTTWLSMSSAGRSIPGGVPAIGSKTPTTNTTATQPVVGGATDSAITSTPPLSGYTLLDYSIGGGIVRETMETDGGETPTPPFLVPGKGAEIITRWLAPAGAGDAPVFALHLLDGEGRIIAQSDTTVQNGGDPDGETVEIISMLDIPADLAPGDYELGGGLFEAATGSRLSFMTAEGDVMWIIRADFIVPPYGNGNAEETNRDIEGRQGEDGTRAGNTDEAPRDMLLVREVSPPNGAALAGTAPFDFVVTVDYALVSLPQAVLEVRVVDLSGENGRGVGLTTVDDISQGNGTTTVVVTVDLGSELTGSTDLGLWLQIRPDPTAPPIFIEKPESYRWRYIR